MAVATLQRKLALALLTAVASGQGAAMTIAPLASRLLFELRSGADRRVIKSNLHVGHVGRNQ